jgi:hypothetical protein
MQLTSIQDVRAFFQEIDCLSTLSTLWTIWAGLVHIHEACQSEAGDMLANLVKCVKGGNSHKGI